jgi:glycosyltransferase involved in cell wall biosynthesis
MRKCTVTVIGYFGYLTNQLDGQTVRTRTVYQLLEKHREELGELCYFDNQLLRSSGFSVIRLLRLIWNSETLVYLPAHNNLKYIFPVIFLLSKIRGVTIVYVVIGGWLDAYLKHKKLHIFMLSRIKALFLQSERLRSNLIAEYNFTNTQILCNFRIHSFVPDFSLNNNGFRIVFMARICRSKGIEDMFRLADFIKNKYPSDNLISIDFYGPVAREDEEYFMREITNSDICNYNGILEPDEIYKMLSTYDVLVLPTKYPGEGFPGTILDAYISGLPVIVTNWMYISEFVEDGKTGFLYDPEDVKQLFSRIELLIQDKKRLLAMKSLAYLAGKQYNADVAWKSIKDYLIRH